MSGPHIRDSNTAVMVKHYDDEGASKNPKQARFLASLREGRNEVLGKHALKTKTGHAIAIGLKPTERYSCIDGVWAWRKL